MERIILEVKSHGLNQYHTVDEFPVTIGRAYDNDIILSDRSISAHHLRIERTEYGSLFIHNLSEENGTSLNGQNVGKQPAEGKVSSLLQLGHLKLRIVSPSTAVEETHRHDCDNIFCLIGKPVWSVLLFITAMSIALFGAFVETQVAKDIFYYITLGFPYLLGILLGSLLFSGISRIAVHRWHFLPIMAVISLFVLLPQLLSHLGHNLNYFFTSDTPQEILTKVGYFIIPFVLIFFFMRKVYRSAPPLAFGVSIAITFFTALPYILDSVDNLSIDTEFSDVPPYNQTLSYLDIRLEQTLSLDDFITETKEKLQKEVRQELEK